MAGHIICVGNRFAAGDDTGPRVHDYLVRSSLPAAVRLTDGGLAGLNLLSLFEEGELVILVDALLGFAPPGCITTLSREQAIAGGSGHYDHDGSLDYLLRLLPSVCEGAPPEVILVGAEGPLDENAIAALAAKALNLALGQDPSLGKARHV